MRCALLIFAACGRISFEESGDAGTTSTNTIEVPSWQSGSRLRARVADFGGVKSVLEWRDTLLDETCNRQPAADGALRCVPSTMANVIYSDDACTQSSGLGVVSVDSCNPAPYPRYAMSGGRRVYAMTMETPGPASFYAIDSSFGGACQLYGPSPNYHFFALGSELAPEAMVLQPATTSGSGRIIAEGWRSDDGAFALQHPFDTNVAEACEFQTAADGVKRCLPDPDYAAYYSDPSCTTRLAQDGAHTYVAVTNGTCGGISLFQRGAIWTGPLYAISGTCTSASAGVTVRELSDELPPSTWVAAKPFVGPPGLPIAEVGWVGGGIVSRTLWQDATDGRSCRIQRTNAFFQRPICLPDGIPAINQYADAACTIPATIGTPGCDASPNDLLFLSVLGCIGDYSVHAIDPAAAPTMAYEKDTFDGTCRTFVIPTTFSGVVTPTPLSTFPQGVEYLE